MRTEVATLLVKGLDCIKRIGAGHNWLAVTDLCFMQAAVQEVNWKNWERPRVTSTQQFCGLWEKNLSRFIWVKERASAPQIHLNSRQPRKGQVSKKERAQSFNITQSKQQTAAHFNQDCPATPIPNHCCSEMMLFVVLPSDEPLIYKWPCRGLRSKKAPLAILCRSAKGQKIGCLENGYFAARLMKVNFCQKLEEKKNHYPKKPGDVHGTIWNQECS